MFSFRRQLLRHCVIALCQIENYVVQNVFFDFPVSSECKSNDKARCAAADATLSLFTATTSSVVVNIAVNRQ